MRLELSLNEPTRPYSWKDNIKAMRATGDRTKKLILNCESMACFKKLPEEINYHDKRYKLMRWEPSNREAIYSTTKEELHAN